MSWEESEKEFGSLDGGSLENFTNFCDFLQILHVGSGFVRALQSKHVERGNFF